MASSRRSAAIDLLIGLPVALAGAAAAGALLGLGSAYPLAVVGIYALVAGSILIGLTAPLPGRGLGGANRVTLGRLLIALPVAGLALVPVEIGDPARVLAIVLGTAAISLDGVDGWVARRTKTESAFGARFDMETDAALILVLCLLVWRSGQAGVWVLAIGAMRYLFVAAGAVRPELNGELPPSFRRKVVCVIQSVVLLVALAPFVPAVAAAAISAGALLALTGSFAVDIAWLLRHSQSVHAAEWSAR